MATAREGVWSAGGGVGVENSCGKIEAGAEKLWTPGFLTLQATMPGRGSERGLDTGRYTQWASDGSHWVLQTDGPTREEPMLLKWQEPRPVRIV